MSRRQLTSFATAGIVGFLIDAGVLYLLIQFGIGLYLGRLVSFLCAIFVTWQMNRRFTFLNAQPRSPWAEWWRYLSAMTFGWLINFITYAAILRIGPDTQWKPLIGVMVGSCIAMFVNFAVSKWWVFNQTS